MPYQIYVVSNSNLVDYTKSKALESSAQAKSKAYEYSAELAQLRMRNKMRKELGLPTIPEDSLRQRVAAKARRGSIKMNEITKERNAARIMRVKKKLKLFNMLTNPKKEAPTLFDAAFDNPNWLEEAKTKIAEPKQEKRNHELDQIQREMRRKEQKRQAEQLAANIVSGAEAVTLRAPTLLLLFKCLIKLIVYIMTPRRKM